MASATMALGSLAAPAASTTAKSSSMLSSSFTGVGLKIPSQPTIKKNNTTSPGSLKINSMLVWQPYDNKKWETLSYLPTLSPEQILKQVDYLLRNGWVPCLEFEENAEICRVYHRSPGYYDGRYWIMWKLPMFGCQDSSQVMQEVNECKKEFPKAYIRVIGFDAKRQVQCISFIVHKP